MSPAASPLDIMRQIEAQQARARRRRRSHRRLGGGLGAEVLDVFTDNTDAFLADENGVPFLAEG